MKKNRPEMAYEFFAKNVLGETFHNGFKVQLGKA